MLAFRPNPNQLLAKTGGQVAAAPSQGRESEEEGDGGSGLGAGKTGIYRPPKLNPVSMDGCVCLGLKGGGG